MVGWRYRGAQALPVPYDVDAYAFTTDAFGDRVFVVEAARWPEGKRAAPGEELYVVTRSSLFVRQKFVKLLSSPSSRRQPGSEGGSVYCGRKLSVHEWLDHDKQ
jgi:hypothetical protein